MALTTQVITTRFELETLEAEWRLLFQRCETAVPFLSPDWMLPWWDEFGSTSAPFVVTARERGRLCGLMPTRTYQGRLYFIGHGITDTIDVLGDNPMVIAVLWQELIDAGLSGELAEIPASSELLRLAAQTVRISVCPAVDLRKWQISRRLAANLRQCDRRLGKLGEVTFDIASREQAPDYLQSWIRLHTTQWQAGDEPGVLHAPEVQNFHRSAGLRLAQAALAEFYGLRIDGELAGVLYALQRQGTTFFYLSGYDPALRPFSPGSLLIRQAFSVAQARGDHTFDFLRGAEPYKFQWGAQERHQYVAFLT